MEILRSSWSNFKSFRGEHEIDFTQFGPGLYFMKGENRAEPDLGANGAGKSTVWDVIHWCLTGTSLRGQKTTELLGAQGTKPQAELDVRLHGKRKRVARTYRPNTVTVGGREKTQEQLEDIIGLGSETIKHSLIIGQFSRMFFDLKAAEKMKVFTELMGLDYWLECAKRASDTLSVLQEDKNKLHLRLASIDGTLKATRKQLAQLKEENKTQFSKLTVHRNIEGKERDITALSAEIQFKYEEKHVLITEKDRIDQRLAKIDEKHNPLLNKRDKLYESLGEKRGVVLAKKETLFAIKDTISDICPTCGQTLSKSHRNKEERRLTSEIKYIKEEMALILSGIKDLDKDLGRSTTRWNNLKAKDPRKDIAELDKEIADLEAMKKVEQGELKQLKKEHAQITRAKRAHEKKIIEVSRQISLDKRTRATIADEIDDLETQIQTTRYWIKGFKDVRLYEISESLMSLQVEVNSYLADLGMENWSTKLDVESETKKGTLRKGFNVMVDSGEKVRSWESWSGGEGQRLRLAGTLGLSSLILRQHGHDSNWQVWDEKMTWLSGSGQDDMLELLQETAKRENKQIWIVDQNRLEFPFDGVLSVIKDRNGSRIEAE